MQLALAQSKLTFREKVRGYVHCSTASNNRKPKNNLNTYLKRANQTSTGPSDKRTMDVC